MTNLVLMPGSWTLIEERKESAYLRYNKGRQLTYDQRVAFEQTQRDKQPTARAIMTRRPRSGLRASGFEDEYKRIYPYNSLACNVIGLYQQ